MAYTPNLQIENGGFTDFEGNPLVDGYLIMQLSHDENFSAGPNQVVAGLKKQIVLNSTGNIPTSPATLVWSNDVLTPGGSFYIVMAYKADGTQAWADQQYWTLLSSPDPLDVGTIVPTNPPGSGGSGSSTLLLETNGTINSNQSLLNIAQGTGVTITNSAGTTTISSTGADFTTSGQGGFIGPNIGSLFPYYSVPTTFVTGGIISGTINQITAFQFVLPYSITISRVSVIIDTAQAGATVNVGIYSAAGSKLLDSGGLSASSTGAVHATITPVALAAGVYYFAQSASNTAVAVETLQPASSKDVNMLNALSVKVGQAANSTSGGLMPATLGTLTADAVYAGVTTALFEV